MSNEMNKLRKRIMFTVQTETIKYLQENEEERKSLSIVQTFFYKFKI